MARSLTACCTGLPVQQRSTHSISAMDDAGAVAFVSSRPNLAALVGPPGSEGSWSAKEIGDGNLNFVYIVQVGCG